MNLKDLNRWQHLTHDGSVRWLKYSWGPATANTLAVRLEDGTWLVIAPSVGSASSVLEDLSKDGTVSALIAPNAYHYLGQRAWRLHFPSATSYAPDGALARLARKSPDVLYRPASELIETIRPRVTFLVPEGMKSPDMLIRVSVAGATVWWMGDLFTNTAVDDQNWLLRMIAPLAGSGMGYRRNSKPGLVYVRNPKAWLHSITNALEAEPPSIVVPAHGNPVTQDAALRTRALLR
jgi:hypothetical protein